MRNLLAFLLCLVMVVSLISCEDLHELIGSNIEDPTSSDNTSLEKLADYREILSLYKLAVDSCANAELTAEALGISDSQEKETFSDILECVKHNYDGEKKADSTSPIYRLTFGYAIKDINGDGVDELVLLKEDYTILAIFSCADGKPIMIGGYSYYRFTTTRPNLTNCWIDGDGVIYTSDLTGFERFRVYRISEDSTSLETVADYGWYLYVDYTTGTITKYYKYVDRQEIEINADEYQSLHEQYEKRLGSYQITEATKEYAGLDYVPLFSEAELIEEIYASALKNETKVYEVDTEEYKFLKACKTPYEKIRLSDVANIEYGYVDLDGDGIGEPVIDCGDTVILRYYDRKVYAYSFTFRQMYYLKTDGSHAWNHTGQDFEYGESQIYFEGAELKEKELYRVVNDGEPDAEYYLGGEQVSHEKILKYFEDNPKTDIEFSSIDKSWYYRLSSEEAYEIAVKYWRLRPDEPDGAAGSIYYADAFVMATPDEDNVYYHFLLISKGYHHDGNGNISSTPHNIIINSELLIDTTTGECIELNERGYYGCGYDYEYAIYPYKAIDIAEEYWGIEQFQNEIIEGTRSFLEIDILKFPHCTDKYYRVVLKREYYTCGEESSENDLPYKVEIINEIFVDAMTGECQKFVV